MPAFVNYEFVRPLYPGDSEKKEGSNKKDQKVQFEDENVRFVNFCLFHGFLHKAFQHAK